MIAAIIISLLGTGLLAVTFGAASSLLVLIRKSSRDVMHHPLRWWQETYTMHRWSSNPFQMYSLLMLWQLSIAQLVFGNIAFTEPQVVAGELDFRNQTVLTVALLIGSTIAAYGLHLREIELSWSIELWGYLALAGQLLVWVALVYFTVPLPNTSFGLNLVEAFVLASIHRSRQILVYKWAKRRSHFNKQAEMRSKLEKTP